MSDDGSDDFDPRSDLGAPSAIGLSSTNGGPKGHEGPGKKSKGVAFALSRFQDDPDLEDMEVPVLRKIEAYDEEELAVTEDDEDDEAVGHEVTDTHGMRTVKHENTGMLTFLLQCAPSCALAGTGMILAGTLLDAVQEWPLFKEVPQLFILTPALLGLKGNLEIVLAARLGTAAHLGHLDDPKARWGMVVANLMLVQCQAIMVSLVASIFSIVVGAIFGVPFTVKNGFLITASAMTTASLASVLLGSLMCGTVILARALELDPDNIATPIAEAFGDSVTLLLLAISGYLLHEMSAVASIISSVILIAFFLAVLGPTGYSYLKYRPTEYGVLTDKAAWTAILIAMIISSCAGLILQQFVTTFKTLAVLAPLMNGMGGNLSVIHASKISTSLHAHTEISRIKNAIVLFLIMIPASDIFLFVIKFFELGTADISIIFIVFYTSAALLQVTLLLGLATVLVAVFWKYDFDPDVVAIPFITSNGDLIGTSLLVTTFAILKAIGQRV